MPSSLYMHDLDGAQFPEFDPPPGRYTLEPVLLTGRADPRLAAPPASPLVLRVAFRLQATVVPAPAWELHVQRLDAQGRTQEHTIGLVPHGQAGTQRIDDPAKLNRPMAKGAIYRGVFWVDLGPALADQSLKPGDRLVLRYGQAEAALVLNLPR
jgi:hypothetical protein